MAVLTPFYHCDETPRQLYKGRIYLVCEFSEIRICHSGEAWKQVKWSRKLREVPKSYLSYLRTSLNEEACFLADLMSTDQQSTVIFRMKMFYCRQYWQLCLRLATPFPDPRHLSLKDLLVPFPRPRKRQNKTKYPKAHVDHKVISG